ncbi:MAG: sulfatase-like hydrolase/transferase [Akkermansiaceae bacterium]
MTSKTTSSALLLALVLILEIASPLQAKERPPNVILIMADDLGYHDLSCYGHPKIKTPVIDGLARDGVKLTSFYAGSTICTPSRMALLTGAYPSRLGWTKGVVGYMMPKRHGLSPDALTIAEVFKSQGYVTGLFGKWHLGDEAPFLPHRQGFDQVFYINKSNNQTKELWRGDQLIAKPFVNRNLTERFTKEAIRFIAENKNRSFLLYLPYSAPHFPVEAHPDWKGKSEFGVYGDVVEEMDARIGEILQTLEREELTRNTVVVFLSDNGPEPMTKASKATPYRGKKWSALEGGTRVPCIIRWPGVIPKGRESNAMVAAIDLLPTLSHACGIDLDSISTGSPVIDGLNVWATLTGKGEGPHARDVLLYWHGADGFQAIRSADWKLFPKRKGASLKGGQGPALFHLAHDLAESTDLSKQRPGGVAALKTIAEKLLAEIEKNKLALGKFVPALK